MNPPPQVVLGASALGLWLVLYALEPSALSPCNLVQDQTNIRDRAVSPDPIPYTLPCAHAVFPKSV